MMDYLVIGAGPAGLQLGHHLQAAGRDHLIVEAGPGVGTFFRTFPRHRQLISINKPHTGWSDPELNLRTDWNSLLSDDPELLFTRYTERYFPAADDLVRYLEDYAAALGLRVQCDTRVERIDRDGRGFRATDQRGRTYEARCVIVATGFTRPNIPDIPGIDHAEVYTTVPVDPAGFTDQRVLIIGRGNSAFETADNLIEKAAVIHVAGPRPLRLAWRTHFVGHLRAVNNNFLDTYQLKSQNALLDGNVVNIERRGDGYLVTFSFVRADEVTKDIPYDRVIVCTGFRFDAGIFGESCRPELVIDDRFPAQTSSWRSTNVPDLYFAGTLTQARDFKRSTSGFIHGFRYGVRALHRILERRYHGVAWPSRPVPTEPAALMEAVLARVNRTSALWQLFGTMGDVVVIDSDGESRYYEEVPVDHAHDGDFGAGDSYCTVTLEYGPDHDLHDPFDLSVERIAQDERTHAHEGRYLHPVVRHFRRGAQVAEHHVTENLENEWDGPQHREPLEAFFADRLAERPSRAPVP